MRNIFPISIVVFFSYLPTSKSIALIIPTSYKDGPTVCKEHANKTSSELGKWVSVPINYNNPQGEKTLIYAYTKFKFDSTKNSVFYFVGGPGSSPRSSEFTVPNMNVIFFEERGIACSRPATRELYLDPKFYSAENSAQDGLMVLNAYGIKRAAIYGHSYGTMPATIFASKFPERTLSLILEGVIFKADESLWISQRKIQLMQSYFDALPLAKQQRILSFSERPDSNKAWFSYFARLVLGTGTFPDGLTTFLDETLFKKSRNQEADDSNFASMIRLSLPKIDTTTPAEEFFSGDVTMGMIACQEINMANPMMSHLLIFENGKLVPDRNNIERKSLCEPLGLANNQNQPYTAEKYPITVPVTYFLGEYDPATSLDQGMQHFKNAQSAQKQVYIMKAGGHTSNIDQLIEGIYCDPTKEKCENYLQQIMQRSLFAKAAQGQLISDSEINQYNALGTRKWMQTVSQ